MLSRLVSFAVVMALVYFALTRGLPWIREQIAPTASSYEATDGDTSDPAGPCIETVARANDSLSRLMRTFSGGPGVVPRESKFPSDPAKGANF